MYSTSAEELEIVGYLLQFHEIVVEPKFIKDPEVDVRLSMSPAKSASEYPTSVKYFYISCKEDQSLLFLEYILTPFLLNFSDFPLVPA